MTEDSVEFQRPGWRAKLKGRDPFPYIIIAALLIFMAYMTSFSLKFWGDPFPLKAALEEHHTNMKDQHSSYINGVSELTYVMSVCLNQSRQRECERLHISMPESLYRKMNNGQQP